MIKKIKEFLPQSAGKCLSKGLVLNIFLGDMLLDLPWHLGPLGPSLHGHRPCFGTEIFHVTTASKLNDSPANI